jgi:hypothetical protein
LAGRRESCSPLREQVEDDGALKRAACPSEKEFDNSIAVLGEEILAFRIWTRYDNIGFKGLEEEETMR